MEQTTKKLTTKDIIELDLSELYIGNLNTIDADLQLPKQGKRGTKLQWESKEILFISHEGNVTRPTYGVGNRVVLMVVTATYEGESGERIFQATVLEQPRETVISELYPVEITITTDEKAELPPVVIAKEDHGILTTLPVVWEEYQLPSIEGSVVVNGSVELTSEKAKAIIHVVSKFNKKEKQKVIRRLQQAPSGSVALKKETRFFDAQEKMISYLLTVDDEQILYNFRLAAKLDIKHAKPMTGWDAPESNLRGHTAGHYLSSLALAWNMTKKKELLAKIDYLIDELVKCQKAQEKLGCQAGFLSAYGEEQFDLLEEYTTYPTIWAPFYTLDKIMSGLLDCYQLAGNEKARELVLNLGKWVYERLKKLSRSKLDKMWSLYIAGEFGGMISVMIRLYRETSEEEYLKAAYFFRNEKLFYPMQENKDTLKDMHANQHIPQIIGALDVYLENGESRYHKIADNFWNMVIASHSYTIGGTGETEMFHEPNRSVDYLTAKSAESCASYNMLRLTSELFELKPESSKMDYYENVLYNHILSSASHDTDGGTTYFMPTCPGGVKEFSTEENTCCHGTGLESRFRYVRDIYAQNEEEFYINLYVPSSFSEEGCDLTMEISFAKKMETVINVSKMRQKKLAIRIPSWAKKHYEIMVGQEILAITPDVDGYIHLERDFTKQQTIKVIFPLVFRRVQAEDGFVSLAYGPYLLAAISEQKEYLRCPDVENLNQEEQHSNNNMIFIIDGVTYMPLSDVNKEAYHIYFKQN